MKRFFWLILVIFLASPAIAQQVPLYSQYSLNPFLYNPAFTGVRQGFNANLIYRKMWTDIKGAPETRALTLDGSIMDNKVGLGAYVYQDFTDILERFGANLSYAYYIKFKKDMRLGIGISAGIQQTRVDWERANTGNDIIDPVVMTNTGSGMNFDGSAGISFIWKGLKAGFAIPQLVETNIRYINNDSPTSYQLARHYLVNASYDIPVIKDKFFIEPLAMFRVTKGMSYQFDIGSSFRYKDFLWVSAMYRYDYAVTFGGGIKVHDRLTVGYSYDYSVNNLQNYAGGTHEMFVGIKFGKKEDKGMIEAIQQLQQNQQLQQDQINKIDLKTDSVSQINNDLKKQNDQLQSDVQSRDAKIKELEGQVNSILNDLAKKDSMLTGTKPSLPSDIVYDGGDDDLMFITGEPSGNYFMVVSSVRTESQARKLAKDYQKDGHKVGVVYNKRRTWYYIFLEQPGTLEDGLKELYQLRKQDEFKDAWIHVYDKDKK
jgi:type IX secretion system PorP/SprF family membrane protein